MIGYTSMNKDIMKSMGFTKEVELVEQKKCPLCGKEIGNEETAFRNPISRKEYKISGMCQACQDSFFGVD